MKRDKDGKPVTDRRSLLKLAGAGVVASGAALVAGGQAAQALEPAQPEGQTYRETEHVKRYYELARYF